MTSSSDDPRYAVLCQAAPVPPLDGCYKPQKPNGYRDSSADIAWTLQQLGHRVVTPVANPDPAVESDWSFPDTAEGIAVARTAGANTLWANTVLYAAHPITRAIAEGVWIIGQELAMAEKYDDKWVTHKLLLLAGLPVPAMLKVGQSANATGTFALAELTDAGIEEHLGGFPVIVKPVRGRGSQGVRRVESLSQLKSAVADLIAARSEFAGKSYPTYGDYVLVEEYLPGQECTVGVLYQSRSPVLCLTPVVRGQHIAGILPYSGDVPVRQNSWLMPPEEFDIPAINRICHDAAQLLMPRAIIRIDCRQDRQSQWRMFDVNLKPNLTGSGRPGRDDQDSLLAIAAGDYANLIGRLAALRWKIFSS
jgi:D-alanine-D-alanine ligase